MGVLAKHFLDLIIISCLSSVPYSLKTVDDTAVEI